MLLFESCLDVCGFIKVIFLGGGFSFGMFFVCVKIQFFFYYCSFLSLFLYFCISVFLYFCISRRSVVFGYALCGCVLFSLTQECNTKTRHRKDGTDGKKKHKKKLVWTGTDEHNTPFVWRWTDSLTDWLILTGSDSYWRWWWWLMIMMVIMIMMMMTYVHVLMHLDEYGKICI